MLNNLLKQISNFSKIGLTCQLCGLDHQQPHSLCQQCWNQLPWYQNEHSQILHRNELEIHIALRYQFPVDRIIQTFKYEQQLHYSTLLMYSLLELKMISKLRPKFQAIVPMPISTERLADRGYNQMLMVAQKLSRHLNIPIWQPIIRSAQHSQKGLSRVERMENISEQFQIINTERRKYKRVLIIDDVVTTGSSLAALKQALEKLGCQQIEIACISAAEI